MLSNKWTFSLTSLVVLIAFGLVCFVPSVMADGDAGAKLNDVTVKISAAEGMIDVDARGTDNDIQIATGRNRDGRDIEIVSGTAVDALAITLLIEFSHVVTLDSPDVGVDAETDDTSGADVTRVESGGNFGADDIFIRAFDKEGRSLGEIKLADAVAADTDRITEANANVITQFRDSALPGRQFLMRIDESQLTNAFAALRGGDLEIYSLVFYIPVGLHGTAGGSATRSRS